MDETETDTVQQRNKQEVMRRRMEQSRGWQCKGIRPGYVDNKHELRPHKLDDLFLSGILFLLKIDEGIGFFLFFIDTGS